MKNSQVRQVVVIVQPKSIGIAIILTFIFGPLGMFYSTVTGAIVMMLISAVVGVMTLGRACPM